LSTPSGKKFLKIFENGNVKFPLKLLLKFNHLQPLFHNLTYRGERRKHL
jgi:hypothetical protein